MDGLNGIMLSEICQRRTNAVYITYVWNLKKYSKLVNVAKTTHRYREQISGY